MFDEDLNPNEGVEEVVTSNEEQATETNETVNADNVETTTTQENEKPVQSKEKNSEFASMRRQMEQEYNAKQQQAVDAEYSRLYGQEFGIHSKADYDNAVAQQEREQQIQADAERQGVSEEYIRRLKDVEDTVATTKAEKQEIANQKAELERQIAMIAEHETLNKDETFSDYYNEHQAEIKASAENFKVDLTTAMLLSIKDNFKAIKEGATKKAQQETIDNIIKNGKSSPGSLGSGGEQQTNTIDSMSSKDFNELINRSLRGEKIKF